MDKQKQLKPRYCVVCGEPAELGLFCDSCRDKKRAEINSRSAINKTEGK